MSAKAGQPAEYHTHGIFSTCTGAILEPVGSDLPSLSTAAHRVTAPPQPAGYSSCISIKIVVWRGARSRKLKPFLRHGMTLPVVSQASTLLNAKLVAI